MKKILIIIKYMPFFNFISLFIFGLFIPIKYKINKSEYVETYFIIAIGSIVYVVLINLIDLILLENIVDYISYIFLYLLGIFICHYVQKFFDIVLSEHNKI